MIGDDDYDEYRDEPDGENVDPFTGVDEDDPFGTDRFELENDTLNDQPHTLY